MIFQNEEFKLSGAVSTGSEVTSFMADLFVGKSDDTESIAGSMYSTSSVFSEATYSGVQESSHVSSYMASIQWQHTHRMMT